MNKARKPLSFLLALMMVLGLFAATPMTVLGATQTDSAYDPSSDTATPDTPMMANLMLLSNDAQRSGSYSPLPGGGTSVSLPNTGGTVTMKTGNCTFAPADYGFYTITVSGGNGVTANFSVSSSTGTVNWLGEVSAAANAKAAVYYMTNDTTYTIGVTATGDAEAKLNVQKLNTSYQQVTSSSGTTVQARVLSNNTGSTVYYQAATKGNVTFGGTIIRGTGNKVDTTASMIDGAIIAVLPNSVVGVSVIINGAGSVAFNRLNAPGRAGPTTVNGSIESYFQYTPTNDGLFILTRSATGSSNNAVSLDDLKKAIVKVTVTDENKTEVNPQFTDLYTARPTTSQASVADAYALKRNETYLFKVVNELTKPSGNTLLKPVTLSLNPLTPVRGTGGSASIRSLPLYDTSGFKAYESGLFQFSPTQSGWYTFDVGQNPVQISEIQGTNSSTIYATPNGWADNLKSSASCKAKASGYFQAGKDYFFQATPQATELEGKSSAPDLTVSVRISKANFPVLTNKSPGEAKITGLAPNAVGYVYFNPSTTTSVNDIYAEPSEDTSFAAGTNPLFTGLIQEIYEVKPSGSDLSVAPITGTTLTTGKDYWIQVKSTPRDDGTDAESGRVYLNTATVQGTQAYVYSPVSQGHLDAAATVMQNGKIVEAEKQTRTYNLTPGADYTLSGSAPGCYDRTIAFKGGEIPGMVLYPVPMKANLPDRHVGYTFSATPPAADSNIIRVKVGATFIGDTDNDGYLIGINVSRSGVAKFGWGPYTSRESTANAMKTEAGGYYFDPFLNDYDKAWIKITYTDASLTGSSIELAESVIYEIDFSGVTKFEKGVDDPPTEKEDPDVVSSLTGKAVGKLSKGGAAGSAEDYVDQVTSGALDASYIDIIKNGSTVKGYITSAQNELKTLFDNQDRQPDGKTVTWRDYAFAYRTSGVSDSIYDRTEDWVGLREDLMNTVVVLPIIDMQLTDVEDHDGNQNVLPTFKLTAYNRVLVTYATIASGTIDSDTITNRLPNGTLKKVADLDTNKNGKVDTTSPDERIQVVQNGADRKVTVDDPTLIKLGSNANFTAADNAPLYVIHTKDSGAVHVYELNDTTYNAAKEFVSPYGLSTFKIAEERIDSSKNRYEAAYIYRITEQGACKIWYKTPADAIAEAEDGDAVYLTSGYAGMDISATNTKANNFVVFATNNGGNVVNLVAKVTVNGKSLNYATVVPNDGTSNGVIAAVYGSGVLNSLKTVRTGAWSEGTIKISNEYAKAGERVTVTVTPNSGVKVTGLSVTPNKGSAKVTVSGSNNSWSFTMPTGLGSTYDYVTVTPLSGNSVTIVSRTGGTVTASSLKPEVGDTVTLSVVPNRGWSLSGLTARNTTTDERVSLSKSSDTRYYFVMEEGGVTVTPTWRSVGVYVNTNSNGTVTPNETEPATGDRVVLTVTPASGKQLSSIQVRTTDGDQAVTTWKVNDSMFAFTKPSSDVTVTTEWRTASSALPYTDSIASWALPYVRDCYTGNLMSGIGNSFSGGNKIDRASVWTILARINGFYPKTIGNPWYAESRVWSVDQNVSDGSSGGSSITREQLATMLYRFAGKPSTKGSLSDFPDRGQVHTDWADTENAMKWCVEKGIMGGDNGRLKPQANATRYEVAKMISVFVDVTNK